MRRILISICLFATSCLAQTNAALLLQKPTVSKTQIVFNYAGDLWIAARDGGDVPGGLLRVWGMKPIRCSRPMARWSRSPAITMATRMYMSSLVQVGSRSG